MLEVDSILSKCLEIAYKITAKVVECSDELTYSWHVDYRSLKKFIYLQKEKKRLTMTGHEFHETWNYNSFS